MAIWPTNRSRPKFRVRENTTIAASSVAKYPSGTQPTGDPNERYRIDQISATGRISTEINTRSALAERVSSSSCGSAPISARRASSRSPASRIAVVLSIAHRRYWRDRSCRAERVPLGFAAVEAPTASYVDALARLSLFADLTHPQLEALAHSFGEEVFAEGQRVIRQDVSGGGFYVILEGDAKVVLDGQERA